MNKPTKSGATPHLTDVNVRRLQQLQDTAGLAFSSHVSRHKAEIDRQHKVFKKKFPILGANIRAAEAVEDEPAPAPEIAPAENDPEGGEKRIAMTEEKDNPAVTPSPTVTAPEVSQQPAIDWRKLRHKRPLSSPKRKAGLPRLHLKSPNGAPPKPPQETAARAPDTPAFTADEEERVLREIAKFEAKRDARDRASFAEPPSPPPRRPAPMPAAAASQTPRKAQPKRQGFSFKNLFDLKPRFRRIDAKDDPGTDL